MKRLGPIVLLGILLGYLASCANDSTRPAGTVAQAPNSPPGLPVLHEEPQPPMFWSGDELRRVAAEQQQLARDDKMPQAGTSTWPVVTVPGQQLGVLSVGDGPYMRAKHSHARFAAFSGLISHYSDADIHCTTCGAHLAVMVAGSGRWIVNGEIANQEINPVMSVSTAAAREVAAGDGQRIVLNTSVNAGEMRGQPVVNGDVFAASPGDWLYVAAGRPHWWLPDPDVGLNYFQVGIPVSNPFAGF